MRGDEKIVRPDWLVASLEAGRLLDYSNFLLYTHATHNPQQPKINSFKSTDKVIKEDVVQEDVAAQKNDSNAKCRTEVAEEAAAAEADPPSPDRWVAKDANDTRFMGEFFSNSRLHHIATMASNAKVIQRFCY